MWVDVGDSKACATAWKFCKTDYRCEREGTYNAPPYKDIYVSNLCVFL